jgi:hypothetical protein
VITLTIRTFHGASLCEVQVVVLTRPHSKPKGYVEDPADPDGGVLLATLRRSDGGGGPVAFAENGGDIWQQNHG